MCVWVCITLMLYYTCEWRVLHMYTLVRRLGVLTNSPFNLFSLFLVSLFFQQGKRQLHALFPSFSLTLGGPHTGPSPSVSVGEGLWQVLLPLGW